MITRHTHIYDLVVLIMYGEASANWFWIVRPLNGDTNYQLEMANGFLYNFVSHRGFAKSEEAAFADASAFAVRTARQRVLPFSRRYLDRLCKIEIGPVVEVP